MLKRPQRPGVKDLPEGVKVSFVEVVELHPPKGAKPIHWLLLTTHPVASAADAWRIVSSVSQPGSSNSFFARSKSQGLRIEDSQLDSVEGLIKLVAMRTRAACRHPAGTSPQWQRRIASRICVHAGRDRSAQGHQQNPERPHRAPEEPPSPRHHAPRQHGSSQSSADGPTTSSPTWTNHLPHGNGSLPDPRLWSSKRVEALVRTQRPVPRDLDMFPSWSWVLALQLNPVVIEYLPSQGRRRGWRTPSPRFISQYSSETPTAPRQSPASPPRFQREGQAAHRVRDRADHDRPQRLADAE